MCVCVFRVFCRCVLRCLGLVLNVSPITVNIMFIFVVSESSRRSELVKIHDFTCTTCIYVYLRVMYEYFF